MKRLIIFFIAGCCLGVWGILPSTSWAQYEEGAVGTANEEYTFGEVKSVSGSELIINEYDFDKDDFVDNAYTVTSETKYEGVQSISELKAGDTVELDYVVQDGKRVVTFLAYAEPLEVEAGEEETEQTQE